MKEIPFFQVDAFTNIALKGNPAAICFVEDDVDGTTMQAIAAENNLAETAFLQTRADGFDLRWFTPSVEVDLCGHATLAAAHVLWEQNIQKSKIVDFYTRSGVLKATQKKDWIELDFPLSEITPIQLPQGILHALNEKPVNAVFAKDRYIIELANEEEVKTIKPDLIALKEFEMVVVTAKGNPGSPYDFVSRTFPPAYGIDEDPVTGSSHCGLTPYWADKLQKTEMFAMQASDRGGELLLKISGNRVLISGQAVTVIKGMFYI